MEFTLNIKLMKITLLSGFFSLLTLQISAQAIQTRVAEDGTTITENIPYDPTDILDTAKEGRKMWLERKDGTTFQSSPDTKFKYIDADGNETTNAKLKELYKANPDIYALRPSVVNEEVVFTLHRVRREQKELIGQTLPVITYPDVNGKEITIPDNQQDLVLCFWATWCGPCIKELQILNGIAGDFPNLRIIALTPESLSEVKSFFTNDKYNWNNITIIPQYREEYMSVIQNKVIPTSVLVSKDGVIQKVFYGTTRQMIVDLDTIIKER